MTAQYVMKKTRLQDALTLAGETQQQPPGPNQLHSSNASEELSDAEQLERVYQRIAERNMTIPRRNIPEAPPPYLSVDQEIQARAAMEIQVSSMQTHCDQSELFQEMIQHEFVSSIETPWKRVDSSGGSGGGANAWYSIGKVVGKGTFGRVQLARHRVSGAHVAIKSYFREKGALSCCAPPATSTSTSSHVKPTTRRPPESDALEWRRVRQEVKLMASLQRHPGIVHFIEAFETPTQLQVVMEFVGGGSLYDLLKRSPHQRLHESKARPIFARLCASVRALHDQNAIHRDLKLENVLLDDHLEPTIIDLGFSQLEFSSSSPAATSATATSNPQRSQTARGVKNFCGTPSYMAPEVISCKSYDGRQVDVWSLGIILYLLLCGKFPFQGANLHQLYQNIRNAQLFFPANVSKPAQQLLQSIFVLDPQRRLPLEAILDHAWLVAAATPYKNQDDLTSPPRECVFGSFMVWENGFSMICDALQRLYGLPRDALMVALRTKKRNSVTALIQLTMLMAEKRFYASLRGESLSTDDAHESKKPEDTIKATAKQRVVQKPPQVKRGVDENDTATPAATTTRGPVSHKQQLEQLIGLVKKSLQ